MHSRYIHLGNKIFHTGHFCLGIGVELAKPGIALTVALTLLTYLRRKDMCMEVDKHSYRASLFLINRFASILSRWLDLSKRDKCGRNGISQPDIFVAEVKMNSLLVSLLCGNMKDRWLIRMTECNQAGSLLIGREMDILALHRFKALTQDRCSGLWRGAMIKGN